jgi:hypothetical protein
MSKKVSGVRTGPDTTGDISAQPEPVVHGPEEVTELDINVSPRGKAKVVKIVKGLMKNFIPENKLKFGQNDPDYINRIMESPAVQIQFITEDGRFFRETFRLTLAGNSKLRKYISRYGNPKIGQEVEYQEDGRGFPRVSL